MKQLPLDIVTGDEPTFESFIPLGNEAAVEAARALHPGQAPLYLWGPSGSGKTHLLGSVARMAQERGWRVHHCDASVSAHLWCAQTQPDVLLLDQADDWTAAHQQAAFAAFVQASSDGAVVISAGRLPPVDLPMRDDIRTRLGWGLVVGMQPLGESALRQVLHQDALRRGLRLGDDVLDYVLSRLSRDLKSLCGLLDRLDRYALSLKRPLTVPLLRQMLEEEHRAAQVDTAAHPP